jgi:hypothetical protein
VNGPLLPTLFYNTFVCASIFTPFCITSKDTCTCVLQWEDKNIVSLSQLTWFNSKVEARLPCHAKGLGELSWDWMDPSCQLFFITLFYVHRFLLLFILLANVPVLVRCNGRKKYSISTPIDLIQHKWSPHLLLYLTLINQLKSRVHISLPSATTCHHNVTIFCALIFSPFYITSKDATCVLQWEDKNIVSLRQLTWFNSKVEARLPCHAKGLGELSWKWMDPSCQLFFITLFPMHRFLLLFILLANIPVLVRCNGRKKI